MLKKDRPATHSKLEALNKCENLAKEIIKTVNDERRIPKRKRSIIGNRLVDHSINCYEYARCANKYIPETIEEKKDRIYQEKNADIECLNLCTDLRLLPTVINCSPTEKWYVNLIEKAVECENILHKWYKSDLKRFDV